MTRRTRETLQLAGLALAILGLVAPEACGQRASGRVEVRWLGQDGHDVIGPSPAPAPAANGVQDIHLRVTGLPPGRRITQATLTGLGGGAWIFNAPGTHWRLEVEQAPGSTVADCYFEVDSPEAGRPWTLSLTLDDGRTAEINFAGGRADPNRRMPSAALAARWEGQKDLLDRCGLGPGVGPDGRIDVRVQLARLQNGVAIKSIDIEAAPHPNARPKGWAHGSNPGRKHAAEFIARADAPTRGDVYFQPDADLTGSKLTLVLVYADNKTDRVTIDAGPCDPALATAKPPAIQWYDRSIAAEWVGQDQPSDPPGHARILIKSLPTDRQLAAVALSGGARSSWSKQLSEKVPFWSEPYSGTLEVKPGPSRGTLVVLFAPNRNEDGQTLLLRLLFSDGTQAVTTLTAGATDPGLICPERPSSSVVTARPGDDLQAIVARGGTVELAGGTYELTAPLTLTRPIVLRGKDDQPATLQFRQPSDAQPWTTALKIRTGQCRLEAFAIRFDGPVRWRDDVSYGAAVIGSSDSFDPHLDNAMPVTANALVRLDIEGPPQASARPGDWVEAIRLGRFVTSRNGRIENCVLRGGTIEVSGGPWTFVGNTHRGTRPGTYSPCVLAVHDGHDLVIESNRTVAAGPSGKTWRFLVLTGSGFRDRVARNTITDVGPRDDDTIPSMNFPELILTEAYRLHFEGRPGGISSDGRLLQIPEPQGEPAKTGSVVAVLAGPGQGTYARVAQAIDPQTLLLEAPIDPKAEVVSLTTGFIDLTVDDNTIDARGGSVAAPLVLVGSQFGLHVANNRFLGGSEPFRIVSCASELPVHWGWSHCPVFGAVVEANSQAQSQRGGEIGVEWSEHTRSSSGRVYLTATLRQNRASGTVKPPDIRLVGHRVAPDAMQISLDSNAAQIAPE